MGLETHKVTKRESDLCKHLTDYKNYFLEVDVVLFRVTLAVLCFGSGVGLMVKWSSSKSMLRCMGKEELFG